VCLLLACGRSGAPGSDDAAPADAALPGDDGGSEGAPDGRQLDGPADASPDIERAADLVPPQTPDTSGYDRTSDGSQREAGAARPAPCVMKAPRHFTLTLPADHLVDLESCFPRTINPWADRIDDPTIARVVLPFLFTVRPGRATYTRTYGGENGLSSSWPVDIEVTPSDVERIDLDAPATELRLYQPQVWGARAVYRDGTTADLGAWVDWSGEPAGAVAFERVTSTRSAPRFVPMLPGDHRVVAAVNGGRSAGPIRVRAEVHPVRIELPTIHDLMDPAPGPQPLFLSLRYDSEPLWFRPANPSAFVSSNPAVFGPNGTSGRCLARGSAKLTVSLSDRIVETTAFCHAPTDATELAVTPEDPIELFQAEGPIFRARATFPGGFTPWVTPVWSSSDPSVASFGTGDQAHNLLAHKPGTTEVTARYAHLTVKRVVVVRNRTAPHP
jgi:hypothetical protein